MKRKIIFRSLAEAEYLGAIAYYESQQPGLGEDFDYKVRQVIQTIARQPNRYPFAIRDIREAPTPRFPYCIYYRVLKTRIFILAVFHQSRDPKEWQSRA
ncbi:MAG TPA: type II toxin-antitoxin system RelE/ParE family toxin [Urbifossiella sp.]|nr:type II toxin-antitoxin system RelE/ParE family toxin [Urbifossiella sp.]